MKEGRKSNISERVDPFKTEAKKYQRAGWGNVKPAGDEESLASIS